MDSHSRVLCFSRDRDLLGTRTLVLERRYDAVGVSSVREMEALPGSSVFDVVILCHSLSQVECRRAIEITRERWPKAKIMSLTASYKSCSSQDSDRVVASTRGPEVLLNSLADLLADGPVAKTAAL